MNDIRIDTFPSNVTEALTMLYLEKQPLEGVTPKELAELYLKTKREIYASLRNQSNTNK